MSRLDIFIDDDEGEDFDELPNTPRVIIPHNDSRGYLTGLIVSDFHSGHWAGFTHPHFESVPNDTTGASHKLYVIRRMCYDFVMSEVAKLRPIDFMIVNGDCIEGKGDKSGGRENIIQDRNEQAACAAECIKAMADPGTEIVMSYGTPHHTGKEEDFEKQIANNVGALKISNHDWCEAGGVVFDYKHKIGSSSSPVGRATALWKAAAWAQKWALRGEYPLADILIRSHVHYHVHTGGMNERPRLLLTTPALQSYGSIFGTRECEGLVDFGFVWVRIYDKHNWKWDAPCLTFDHQLDIVRLCK